MSYIGALSEKFERKAIRLHEVASVIANYQGKLLPEQATPQKLNTHQEQVAEFHRATDAPIVAQPAVPPEDRLALRIKLLAEEFDEAVEAMSEAESGSLDALAHVAKELADVLVVTYGAALEWGIDLGPVMDAVHASNMAKVGLDGKVQRRPDGKILKPEGWQPPNIEAVLAEQKDLA